MKAEEIVNYLVNSKGYSPHIAAGIVGNLEQESSLDPTAINQKSGAMGLGQWLGSRKAALQDFAMNQGTAPTDPYVQLDFLDHELNTTESNAMAKLLITKSPADAATVFSNHYERASHAESNNDRRVSLAEKAFNFIMPTASADERVLTEEEYNALQVPQDGHILTEEEYNALPAAPQVDPQVLAKADQQLRALKPQNWEGSTGQMPKSLSWSDVPGEAASNFIPSAVNVVGGMAESFLHPIDTATNVAGLIRGGMQKALPDSVANFLIKNGVTPEARPQADALINLYTDRYGSEEGFKNAIAKDPASVLIDFATALQGSGALVREAGLPRVGNAMIKGANYVDPVALTAKGVSKVASTVVPPVLGVATSAGEMPIRKAYEAGQSQPIVAKSFQSAMRGKVDISDIVDIAKNSLKGIRRYNKVIYDAGMQYIANDPTVLDFSNIQKAADDAFKIGMYHDKSLSPTTATTRRKIESVIKSWAEDDPAIYHTAAGLDALKKAIQSIGESLEPRTPASAMASKVSNAIKDEIIKQHSRYKNVMENYSKATNEADDIEKTFSLGKKPTEDTTIRKLRSVAKNNVYTNYGRRENLARKLDAMAGYNDLTYNPLIYKITGQALNNWAPRGLAGSTATLGSIVSAAMSPGLLLGLPLASPRLMGEASYYAGKGGGLLKDLFEGTHIDPATLNRLLYEIQQQQQQQ